MDPKPDQLRLEDVPAIVAEIRAEIYLISEIVKKFPRLLEESEDQLMTIEEASEFTKLAVQTLYGYRCKRLIPVHIAPGSRKLLFSKKELTQWIMSGRRNVIYNK